MPLATRVVIITLHPHSVKRILDRRRPPRVAAEILAMPDESPVEQPTPKHWYTGVTRYQWTVLIIASLGWVFDVFEGQIFVTSMNEAMPELVPPDQHHNIPLYNNITFGCFLLGGALGGIIFGILSDRIGRKRTMIYTIVIYSAFTAVSAASQAWWHMAALRFLVALGVGGEWAVASAMVAEVFPKHARAWSLGFFHASSLIGVYLAIAAGGFISGNPDLSWRWGFLIGVLPAFLIIWVRTSLRETDTWQKTRDSGASSQAQMGRFSDLFASDVARKTIIGVGLATVGLATYWGVFVYAKDILRQDAEARLLMADAVVSAEQRADLLKSHQQEIKWWEMLGHTLAVTGGGIGLLCFGPLSERVGRRGAFLFFHVGAFVSSVILFQFVEGRTALLMTLPLFGFLAIGMHSGYAIYFPELFPTRLRGTGTGFAFNVGRTLAAPILIVTGWLQGESGFGLSLRDAAALLSTLYLLGIGLALIAPETRGEELPE